MESTTCDHVAISVVDVRTLILLLRSPEPGICVNSADAITKYAEKSLKQRIQLLNLGIVLPLLDLTKSKDASTRRSAAACLAASFENVDMHQDMRKHDLIVALISLLTGEAPEVQEEAAFALANLARDFSNKTEIRTEGGIKALIKLLDSPDPDCRKNGAHALSAVLDDFTNRHELRSAGGVQPLLDLVNAEYLEIQENALLCLIRCTEDFATRVDIRKIGGIKRFIEALGHDSPGLHYLTLLCLSNCLEDGEMALQFIENGGIQAVAKSLTTEDAKTKRHAAIVVSRIARNEKANALMKDAGILQALTANVTLTDPQTVAGAALAIATLAKSDLNRSEFLRLGAVENLFAKLAHEDREVIRNAEWALAGLALNAKVRTKVRTMDVPTRIIALLQQYHDDAAILAGGCEFIANMAEDSDLRATIIKQGAVPILVNVLSSSDVKAVASAALALSRLALDAEGRTSLDENKAIPKLTELLSSPDLQVVRNASYAVAAACQLDVNAHTACKSGAVNTLVTLSRTSSKSAASFATDALSKLLDYHLPVKYWLRSRLDLTDTIQNGFYDIGPAAATDSCFPSLQDLQAMPVNQKREVLVVDFTNDTVLNTLVMKITSDGFYESTTSRADQIKKIADTVVETMGGTGEQPFQFRIAELKLNLASNVIPLGKIDRGGLYHRSLLFKVLADKVGVKAMLVRGDFNRFWNVVDLNGVTTKPVVVVAAPVLETTTQASRKPSSSPVSNHEAHKEEPVSISLTPEKEQLVSVDVLTSPGSITAYSRPNVQ
ncbi:hypothetical protein SmJEL517_g00466 [Synchytrium microbalum]|uniref:EDR1/CTR1/ARMC3-like peptidase-like domain-containing protein n=1 Tax=Synchytrium microbalum TaxID=1806994 RepID=A0A507CCS1_9FUNG|nr:uncharacterized protein SmJEL517_g00466 [Synchytrium microbalum]TPX37412.1 hypothetical protein SmJEL517_g00466 [Synchytrium microbalum]